MIRYYLGEEPILPIVETYLLRDPDVQPKVLRDLDRYVVKPTGASGGYGVVIGPMRREKGWRRRARIELGQPGSSRNRSSSLRSIRPLAGAVADGKPALSAAPCRFAAVRAARAKGRGCWPEGLRESRCAKDRWSSIRRKAAAARIPGCWAHSAATNCRSSVLGRALSGARRVARAAGRRQLSSADRDRRRAIRAPWEPLLAFSARKSCSRPSHSIADEASVLDFFILDMENPSSIRSCIESRVRTCARCAI